MTKKTTMVILSLFIGMGFCSVAEWLQNTLKLNSNNLSSVLGLIVVATFIEFKFAGRRFGSRVRVFVELACEVLAGIGSRSIIFPIIGIIPIIGPYLTDRIPINIIMILTTAVTAVATLEKSGTGSGE